MTSIILIEDSVLFRSALETVLRRSGYPVTAYGVDESVPHALRESAIVLLDVVTHLGGNTEIADLVKKWSVRAPVLLLGREDRIEQILVGLRAGAVGCVTQTVSPKTLRRAVAAIAAGGTWCDRRLFQRILQSLTVEGERLSPRLTKREGQALRYLAQGWTNREIAEAIDLTEQSIKIHVSNLLRKTGTSNRTGLLLYAIRHGLVRG